MAYLRYIRSQGPDATSLELREGDAVAEVPDRSQHLGVHLPIGRDDVGRRATFRDRVARTW